MAIESCDIIKIVTNHFQNLPRNNNIEINNMKNNNQTCMQLNKVWNKKERIENKHNASNKR
jgi:hypothetical protein